MIRATQHIPAFVDGVTGSVATVDSVAALLALPWIARWTDNVPPPFYRWSVSHEPGGRLGRLMAEYDGGRRWWVVAYLDSDTPIDLPRFVLPAASDHAAPAS